MEMKLSIGDDNAELMTVVTDNARVSWESSVVSMRLSPCIHYGAAKDKRETLTPPSGQVPEPIPCCIFPCFLLCLFVFKIVCMCYMSATKRGVRSPGWSYRRL